jgi:hypothetical protein
MVSKIQVSPAVNVKVEEKQPAISNEFASDGFTKFCGRTSLHGWKYLNIEAGIFPKAVWIVALAFSLGLSFYFISLNFKQFSDSDTRTTIESTTASLQDIIFPSIYVCNINQVTRSFLKTLDVGNSTDNINLLFDEFLDGVGPDSPDDPEALARMSSKLKSVYGWKKSIPFVRFSSQNCSEMLVLAGNFTYMT